MSAKMMMNRFFTVLKVLPSLLSTDEIIKNILERQANQLGFRNAWFENYTSYSNRHWTRAIKQFRTLDVFLLVELNGRPRPYTKQQPRMESNDLSPSIILLLLLSSSLDLLTTSCYQGFSWKARADTVSNGKILTPQETASSSLWFQIFAQTPLCGYHLQYCILLRGNMRLQVWKPWM